MIVILLEKNSLFLLMIFLLTIKNWKNLVIFGKKNESIYKINSFFTIIKIIVNLFKKYYNAYILRN